MRAFLSVLSVGALLGRGRLAATNEPRGAPYYTTEAWRTAYKETVERFRV